MSSIEEKFLKKVEKTNSCWNWVGCTTSKGRGRFRYNGKTEYSHRVSFILFRGVFDPTMYICHTCDNTLCVNPDHLFIGTQNDNMKDMVNKGRGYNKEQANNPNWKGGISSNWKEYSANWRKNRGTQNKPR